MQGDTIVIEAHHRHAALEISRAILPAIQSTTSRYTISVAGESGSGKSEVATAIAEALAKSAINSIILQQDDYFVYPPRSNDKQRRKDIDWVGTGEVRLDAMDENLKQFLQGAAKLDKPLVIYKEDRITHESLSTGDARVALAEGTYTSLLENIDTRVFIARTYLDTRAHREKRSRDSSELDPFIDRVLTIEHEIISAHRQRADIIIDKDYEVSVVNA